MLCPCRLENQKTHTEYYTSLFNFNQGIAGALAGGRIAYVFDNVGIPQVLKQVLCWRQMHAACHIVVDCHIVEVPVKGHESCCYRPSKEVHELRVYLHVLTCIALRGNQAQSGGRTAACVPSATWPCTADNQLHGSHVAAGQPRSLHKELQHLLGQDRHQ